jgi:PAS domain S-box-containing protein
MFASLFAPGLSPHGICLLWEPGLLWLHAISDLVTGLAYYAIPVGLAYLIVIRRDLAFGWMFTLFAVFILACGTTHFMDIWVLWHPDYAMQGLIKAFTAFASILTAGLLLRLLPHLRTLPTAAQFRQVSERLSAETVKYERTFERLHRSEEDFELLVDSVRDCGMFMVDLSGVVTTWNTGARNVKQYAAEEIIGRNFACFYTPEDRSANKPMRALETAARDGQFKDEGWRLRKDGTRFIADVVINPIHDRTGAIIGFAKVTRDITERKKAEAALEQARAALAHSQKMEAVGQLTGGITHDFNNMLTAILGSVELLKAGQEPIGPNAARMLKVIEQAAHRGADLTRRLLAFSRKQALAPAVTDLNGLVAGMSELLRSTLGESVAVEATLASGLWPAYVDPNQLESAILNLAVNARDAMESGGLLSIGTGNVVLTDAFTRHHADLAPGHYVVITVRDSGQGMTPDVLSRAFEPFFTTKSIGQGTGLGLSQVYGFIKQSGGHIELSSEPGRGTVVKLYLRRHREQAVAEPVKPPAHAAAPPTGDETVLVVDDDDDVRGYSADAARHLGYTVLEANSAARAMAVIDEHPNIDLLFTDVGLPVVNGRQLAETAKSRLPRLKIVYTSGYSPSEVARLGISDRGIRFLSKPFGIEGLAVALRSALDEA